MGAVGDAARAGTGLCARLRCRTRRPASAELTRKRFVGVAAGGARA